ncbi:phosphotransferase [Virgibacillus salexigens]|nr:phosphotransferase [Virgibacillus massiliensis]
MSRDESYHRLSSFFFHKGELMVKKIRMIKQPSVYSLTTSDEQKYIVKHHLQRQKVKRQWEFFEAMEDRTIINTFIHFPNGKAYLDSDDGVWTIAPYLEGKKLHYMNEEDRWKALECITQFHQNAVHIYPRSSRTNTEYIKRWYQRILLFQETKAIFDHYHFTSLFQDIIQTAKYYLSKCMQIPIRQYEEEAIMNGKWIHGDVAAHNFLKVDNTVYLIDFDLVRNTAPIYDKIQLGQRFLPYIGWNLNKLLSYPMVNEYDLKAWLYAICIPVDIMREWLRFLRQGNHSNSYNELIHIQNKWEIRQYFFNDMKIMLE